MVDGCGGRRSRARSPLCPSVPCGRPLGLLPCTTGVRGARHADRGLSCGHSTISPAASAAGVAWGDAQGGLWRRGPVWWRSHGRRRASAGAVPLRRPALPPARRRRLSQASGARRAWPAGAGGCGRRRAGTGGAPRVSLPRPQTVSGPVSPCGGLPRAQGAGCACSASLTCVGGASTMPTVSRLRQRVARVRRGRGQACALGCPAGEGAPGPVGPRQVGSRGHSGAEQRTGADRANGSRCCKSIVRGAAAHRQR
jgi:hypothetical protein